MPAKKSPNTKQRSKRNSAQWIRNAAKSLGMTGLDVVKEIIPNTADIVESTAQGAKDISNTIRSSTSIDKVQSQLSRNRYVRLGQTALKNALEDLKAGNFYDNTSRGFGGFGDSDSGMNFGDLDPDEGQVNVINNDLSSESKAHLAEISRRQSESILTAAQAQINTNIATTSARMALSQEISDRIVGKLDQINNNLSALVQFNNENMSKFIQSSTAYFEKMGTRMEQEDKAKTQLTAADVVRGKKGGLKLSDYTKLVMQQGQEYIKNSTIGSTAAMIDSMGDLLVQSPLKLITSQLIEKAIPTLVKQTAKSLDSAIGNAMTSGLQQLYNTWGQNTGTGMMDLAKRFIGEAFGLRVDKKNTIDLSGKVTKDPAVFDGYTRHAIIEQIPKYLRESTAYLRTITEYLTGSDSKDSLKRAEAFDYKQGFYRSLSDISNEVYGGIRDVVSNAMRESAFGKSMAQAGSARGVDNVEYQNALSNFFYELARNGAPTTRHGRTSWMGEIDSILGNVQTDDRTKAYLRAAVERTWDKRQGGLNMGSAVLNAQAEMRNRIQDMENNPEAYNLYAVNQTQQPIDDVVSSVIYGDNEPAQVDKRIASRGSLVDILENVNYLLERGINVRVTGKKAYKQNEDIGYRPNRKAVPKVPIQREEQEKSGKKGKNDKPFDPKEIEAELAEAMPEEGEDETLAGWAKRLKARGKLVVNSIYDILEGHPIQGIRGISAAIGGSKAGDRIGDAAERGGQKAKGAIGKIDNLLNAPKDQVFNRIRDFLGFGRETKWTVFSPDGSSRDVKERKKSPNAMIEAIQSTIRDGFAGYYEALFGKKYDPDKDGDVKEQVKKAFQARLDKLKILKEKPEYKHALNISKGASIGGIIGSMFGGPLVGGLIGSVTGMISQSNTWKEFIYGKEEEVTDEEGNVKKVRSGGIKEKLIKIWNEQSAKMGITETDSETGKETVKKKFSMGAAGASLGLIASMFTPLGPIGGALAGIGSSLVFGNKRVQEYIFGKRDGEGNKEKAGLLDRMGNMVAAYWGNPLKEAARRMMRTGGNFIYDAIVEPLTAALEPFTILGHRIVNGVTAQLQKVGEASMKFISNTAYSFLQLPIFNPIRNITGFASKAASRVIEAVGGHSPLLAVGSAVDRLNRRASRKKVIDELNMIVNSKSASEEQKAAARRQLMLIDRGDADAIEQAETTHYKSNIRETIQKRKERRAKRAVEEDEADAKVDAKLRNEQFIARMTRGELREDTPENRAKAQAIFEEMKSKHRFKNRVMGYDRDFSILTEEDKKRQTDATTTGETGEAGTSTVGETAQKETADNTAETAKNTDLILQEFTTANQKFEMYLKGILYQSQANRNILENRVNNAKTEKGREKALQDLQVFDETVGTNPIAYASPKVQRELAQLKANRDKAEELYKKSVKQDKKDERREKIWTNPITGTALRGVAGINRVVGPRGLVSKGVGKVGKGIIHRLPILGHHYRLQRKGKALLEEERLAQEAADAAEREQNETLDLYQDTAHEGNWLSWAHGLENIGLNLGEFNVANVSDALSAFGITDPDNLPKFAKGVRNAKGGWGITGENGPELTYIPEGSSIIPNEKAIRVQIVGIDNEALTDTTKFFDSNPLSTAVQATTGILPVYQMGRLTPNTDNKDSILKTAEVEGNIHPDQVDADIYDTIPGTGTGENTEDKEKKGIFDILSQWANGDGIIGNITKFLSNIGGKLKPLASLAAVVGSVLPAIASFFGIKKIGKEIMETTYSNENTAEVDENGVVQLNEDGSVKEWDTSEQNAKMSIFDKVANWLAPNQTKIDMETGKASTSNVITEETFDKANMVVKGVPKGFQISSKLVPTMGKWGATNLANMAGGAVSKVGTGVTNALFGKTGGYIFREGSKELIGNAASKAASAAKTTAAKIADTAVTKGGGIINSFKTTAVELATKLADKLISGLKKFGFSNAADAVSDFCGKILSNFSDDLLVKESGKIADFMTSLTAKANVIGPIIELLQIGIGGVNGASNPGYYFECDLDNENLGKNARLLMRAICAVIGALKGSTLGAFVDLVCYILGWDWAKVLANTIYNVVMGKKGEEALQAAKDDFAGDYDEYVQKEYEKYKEYTEAQGQEAATFEEFVESGAATTFDEYNQQEHQSALAKAGNVLKNVFTGGNKKEITNKVKLDTNAQASTYVSGGKTTQPSTTTTPKKASSYLGGGAGGDDAVPYYSQNDPMWKNASYGSDSTMGKAGCGPTAMAMAVSGATGKNINPMQMANFASSQGYRDNTGTNQAFIDSAAQATGVGSTSATNPNSQFLDRELSKGKPVVLLGRKGGYGSDQSAFTDVGHYVVATGKTNDGKVIIKDPRGKRYSGKYDEKSLLGESAKAWSIGGRGTATDSSATTTTSTGGSNRVTAQNVVDVALNEVGYVEKATNEQLNDPKANPGDNNYTKYGEWMGVNGDYWCASFVCWCFGTAANGSKEKAAQLLGGKLSALCQAILNQMSSQNRMTNDPAPGDLIFFDTGAIDGKANHIGIVISATADKVNTVEGNTSSGSKVEPNGGEVAKKSYNRSNERIIGYARPFYDDASDFQGVSAYTSTDTSTDGTSTTGTSAVTGTTESSSSGLNFFSNIGSKLSSLGDRIQNFLFSGNKEDLKEPQTTTNGTSTGDSGVLDSATAQEASVQAFNFDGSDNAEALWNYFKSLGYSDAATSAIIGNLQGESGVSLNPAQVQIGSGHAAGLAQWESYKNKSGRWLEMSNFAQAQGKDWTDLGSQAQFIHHELSGSQKHYFTKNSKAMQAAGAQPTTYEDWMKSDNVDMATRQFEAAYERAGKPRIDTRIAYAQGIYNKYAGTKGNSTIGQEDTSGDTTTTEGGAGDFFGGFGPGDASTDMTTNSIGNTESRRITVNTQATASNSNQPMEILRTIVEILSTIADNTGTTSSKLDNLRASTYNTQNNDNRSTIISATNGSQPTTERGFDVASANRYKKAQQIAKGGL